MNSYSRFNLMKPAGVTGGSAALTVAGRGTAGAALGSKA
jgi:hypothetical protein